MLHTVRYLLWQKINRNLYSQQAPHISPSRASYGLYIVRNLEKFNRVITAPQCIKNLPVSYISFIHPLKPKQESR